MTRFVLVLVCCAFAFTLGCGDDPRRPGGRIPDASAPDTATDSGSDTSRPPLPDGGSVDDCSEAARWVYVVDSDGTLIRFEPDSSTFTPIGNLDCPVNLGVTPFSMSVDRAANAWVLYSDGNVFRVSTTDASCTVTGFTPNQAGFEVFGMGFVADGPMATAETLYIAGGPSSMIGSGANLGTLNTSTLTIAGANTLPGWPELTGTGLGELWGFFPMTTPASVRQIDKSSSATLRTFDLASLDTTATQAWAFAFWGGRFYVFIQAFLDTSTNVWRLDPSDGSFVELVHDSGLRIVGAGVSTCAPVELI